MVLKIFQDAKNAEERWTIRMLEASMMVTKLFVLALVHQTQKRNNWLLKKHAYEYMEHEFVLRVIKLN